MNLETENMLLRGALETIAKTECLCGVPPYTDGEPCNSCFAKQMLISTNASQHSIEAGGNCPHPFSSTEVYGKTAICGDCGKKFPIATA